MDAVGRKRKSRQHSRKSGSHWNRMKDHGQTFDCRDCVYRTNQRCRFPDFHATVTIPKVPYVRHRNIFERSVTRQEPHVELRCRAMLMYIVGSQPALSCQPGRLQDTRDILLYSSNSTVLVITEGIGGFALDLATGDPLPYIVRSTPNCWSLIGGRSFETLALAPGASGRMAARD